MKPDDTLTAFSKFLSLVLRHHPELIGLNMDPNGWVLIEELIEKASLHKKMNLTVELIDEIVRTNSKKRFILDETGTRIRANQGHSIHVDLELKPQIPPDILFHGTADRFLDKILLEGLKPMSRTQVHLSSSIGTALEVGRRHGRPVVLHVMAKAMHDAGFHFYLSENHVWLVNTVPPEYIRR